DGRGWSNGSRRTFLVCARARDTRKSQKTAEDEGRSGPAFVAHEISSELFGHNRTGTRRASYEAFASIPLLLAPRELTEASGDWGEWRVNARRNRDRLFGAAAVLAYLGRDFFAGFWRDLSDLSHRCFSFSKASSSRPDPRS